MFGLPISVLMAFPGGLGALGLWTGLACTASVQALLMAITVFRWAGQGGWVEGGGLGLDRFKSGGQRQDTPRAGWERTGSTNPRV